MQLKAFTAGGEGMMSLWFNVSMEWAAGGPAGVWGSRGLRTAEAERAEAGGRRQLQQHRVVEPQWRTSTASPGKTDPCNSDSVTQWAFKVKIRFYF